MLSKRFGFSLIMLAVALLIAVPSPMLAQTAQTQVAQPSEGGVNWSGAGFGALAVLANVPYIPAKLVYALLGGVCGAGTWALTGGNTQVADTVWRSALGGDYVVTPSMIQGKQSWNFSGPTETAPEAPKAASAATGSPPATGPASVLNGAPIASAPTFGAAPDSGTPATPPASGASPQPIDKGTGPVAGTTEKSVE